MFRQSGGSGETERERENSGSGIRTCHGLGTLKAPGESEAAMESEKDAEKDTES